MINLTVIKILFKKFYDYLMILKIFALFNKIITLNMNAF